MVFDLRRALIALLVMVVVGFLLAIVLGPLLVTLKAPPAVFVGDIFVNWGWPIGVFVGLWYYFTGGTWRV